jgi:membrane-bound metal-dependent hydrolase YbcI (DUF457 family)
VFIGHFAVAFAAKRAAPRTSLGATFVAAQLADMLWPIFLLIGVEQVRIAPGPNPFLNLVFTSYPWSHSLLMELVWGALLGGLYFAFTRNGRGALVLALLVPSHWLLDLIVHVPDLPLYPGASGRLGFGLWRNPVATMVIELTLFAIGVGIYIASTCARDRVGRFRLLTLVAFLLVLYAASTLSPPPPSVTALAWGAMIGWPLTLWPWWVDRHRDVAISAEATQSR